MALFQRPESLFRSLVRNIIIFLHNLARKGCRNPEMLPAIGASTPPLRGGGGGLLDGTDLLHRGHAARAQLPLPGDPADREGAKARPFALSMLHIITE